MHANDLIKVNNEKRALLNEVNKKQYGDMLVYIRSNLTKSTQETEEILIELLEHLLVAQEEGKTAKDIFGEDLQAYCDDIIGELPKEKKKDAILFIFFLGANFISIYFISEALLSYIFTSFGKGTLEWTLSLGKTAIVFSLLILTAFAIIYFIITWIHKTAMSHKETFSLKDFFIVWLIIVIVATPVVLSFIFIPSFGIEIVIPKVYTLIVGILLALCAYLINKKYRITK